MPLKYAYSACIHHKVIPQYSTLRYIPPRLIKHTIKAGLSMHTLRDNLVQTFRFGFLA